MQLPEKLGVPENLTSKENNLPGIWLPGKFIFWEIWIPMEMWLPGKCEFLGNVLLENAIPQEYWLSEKFGFPDIDFP